LPIETRMLKSLEKTALVAGISLDSIDLKDKSPWGRKNLYQKAETLGSDDHYFVMFSGLSHTVHGSWQDLYDHHVATNANGGFTPTLEWDRPRPQLILALGIIVVEANQQYFRFMRGEPASRQMTEALADLDSRIHEADGAHEAFLAKKMGQTTSGPSKSAAK
jgi:hypothetical protein